ncbi:MAG: APC family permease [Pseudomonadota bacterium]
MKETQPQRETLTKSLSLLSLFTLSFGTIIGVGWITVLGAWVSGAGSMGAALAFLIGGAIMLPIALCYAEIAGMFPVSGGEVAYVFKVYGERAAFFAGWLLSYVYIAVVAFEAVSIGWVLSAMLPGIEGPVLYTFLGSDVRLWTVMVGLALMALITTINYRGAQAASSLQTGLVIVLVLTSTVFLVAGFANGDPAHLTPRFVGNTGQEVIFGVLAVVATTPFWFGGFDTIPQAMGEVSEDTDLRRVAGVMVFAITVALLFYIGIILAATVAVDRNALLSFSLPIAAAADALLGREMRQLVLFAGLCGLLTTWNAMFYAAMRVLFALGRARMVPGGFARVHPRFGSPAFAALFVGVVGGLGSLMGKQTIGIVANSSALVFAFLFTAIVLAVILLRQRAPEHARPYRFPGGRWSLGLTLLLSVLVLVLAIATPLYQSGGALPTEWLLLFIWMLLGVGFYTASRPLRKELPVEQRQRSILNE